MSETTQTNVANLVSGYRMISTLHVQNFVTNWPRLTKL